MSAVPRTAIAAAVLSLGACGGEQIGGSVEVPDGYETYKGEGVSFAYPKGMRRTEQRLPSGARLVRLVGAATGGRPSAYVNFTVRPADAEVFDDVVRTTRSVFERGNGAKVEQSSVDVEDADAARRLAVETPAGEGRSRPETSQTLLVKDAKRVLILTAGRQEGRESGLDEAAVIDSFRLGGS